MLFTNLAHATGEVANTVPATNVMGSFFIPMILIFGIFYFMLIRPQLKKQKEISALLNSLQKGDQVVAAGGLIGEIEKIDGDVVHIKVSKEDSIKVIKESITDRYKAGVVHKEAVKAKETVKPASLKGKKK
jgi:preprotein translocase subunit YajC